MFVTVVGGSSIDEVDDLGDLVVDLGDLDAGFGETASFLVVGSGGTGEVLQ